jgi:hypothetical protein
MDDGTVYVDRHIQKLIVSPSFICDDRFSIETLKIAHIDERINENSPENKIEYSYQIETKLSENIENSNGFEIKLSGKASQLFNSVAG